MAKQLEVLLTKNVYKLGRMGDIVKVRPGYARNFLLPSGQAVPASAAAKRQIEVLRSRAAEQLTREKAIAEGEKKTCWQHIANVSHDTALFGSVALVKSLKPRRRRDRKRISTARNSKAGRAHGYCRSV